VYLNAQQKELVGWLRKARVEEPAAYEADGRTIEDQSGLLVSEARIREECIHLSLDSRETLALLTGYGLLEPVPAEAHGGDERLYYVTRQATVANHEAGAPAVTPARKTKGKPGRPKTIERDVAYLREFQERGQSEDSLTVERFAFEKGLDRSAMSYALKRGAEAELREGGGTVN